LRWGGLPTFAGVVLAEVSVILVFGVVFAVFLCPFAFVFVPVGRLQTGTHGVGWCVKVVFMVFTVLGGAH